MKGKVRCGEVTITVIKNVITFSTVGEQVNKISYLERSSMWLV